MPQMLRCVEWPLSVRRLGSSQEYKHKHNHCRTWACVYDLTEESAPWLRELFSLVCGEWCGIRDCLTEEEILGLESEKDVVIQKNGMKENHGGLRRWDAMEISTNVLWLGHRFISGWDEEWPERWADIFLTPLWATLKSLHLSHSHWGAMEIS